MENATRATKASPNGTVALPPNVEVAQIGPAEAKMLLAFNTHNRRIKTKSVSKMVRAMKSGEWRFNGDPLRFAEDGTLLDGQNRLTAVIIAEVTLPFLIVKNLPAQTQETMDVGSPRSFADTLTLRGYTDVMALQATSRLVWTYAETETLIRQRTDPTFGQLLRLIEENPDFIDSIRIGGQINNRLPGLPKSWGATLHFLFSIADREDADAFFTQAKEGVNLERTDPVYHVRSLLTAPPSKMRAAPRPIYGALTIKAFNYWREGRAMRQLVWRPGGANAEEFPKIDGLDPADIKR